ncbi:MAG: hypothetical protein ACRD0P_01220 [Stackebrandtia sp.]
MSFLPRELRALWSRRPRPPAWVIDAVVVAVVLAGHSAPFLVTARDMNPGQGWTLPQFPPVLGQALSL